MRFLGWRIVSGWFDIILVHAFGVGELKFWGESGLRVISIGIYSKVPLTAGRLINTIARPWIRLLGR